MTRTEKGRPSAGEGGYFLPVTPARLTALNYECYLAIMNIELKGDSCKCFISSGVVSLLVLVSEWSKLKKDACKHVDVILLLLCGIDRISKHEDFPIESIHEELKSVDGNLLKDYVCRVQEVSSDISKLMSLFDVLVTQLQNPKECVVFDKDLNNSVLGIFVRRSVHEYQALTFFQLCSIHKRWTSSLKLSKKSSYSNFIKSSNSDISCVMQGVMLGRASGLTECGTIVQQSPKNMVEVAALQMAQVHGKFGHKKESVLALQEAIRIAQQRNTSFVLEYALGWLIMFQPVKIGKISYVLNRFVLNAMELDLPMLGMWGQLQKAKHLFSNCVNIKRTKEILMDPFPFFHTEKASLLYQNFLLALEGSVLDQCGLRLAGLFCSQLLHQMPTESDSIYLREKEEFFALSVSSIARYLYMNGRCVKCLQLLAVAKNMSSSTESMKVLSVCIEEIKFDRSICLDDFAAAKQHLANIHLLDPSRANYKSAVLLAKYGNVTLRNLLPRMPEACVKEKDDYRQDILFKKFPEMARIVHCEYHKNC